MSAADYDVVWDGAHRDCDADLLAADPVEKRPAPAGDRSTPRLEDVVALLRRSPLVTMAEIAAAVGTTTHTVNAALYTLRKHGVVEAVETHVKRPWGGTLYRYRYIGDVRAGDRVRGTRADRAPTTHGPSRKGGRSPSKADRSARLLRFPAR